MTTKEEKYKTLFELEISKEEFRNTYTLRARIGIYIAIFLGLINLKFKKN